VCDYQAFVNCKGRDMNQQTYIVKFTGVSVADANRYASELRDTLHFLSPKSEA